MKKKQVVITILLSVTLTVIIAICTTAVVLFNKDKAAEAKAPVTPTKSTLQPKPTVSAPMFILNPSLEPEPTEIPIVSLTKPPVPTIVPTQTHTQTSTYSPTPTEKWTPYPTIAPIPEHTIKPTEQPLKELENVDFSKKTINVSAMGGQYKTQGRTPMKNGVVYLNYSASAFSFNAYCEGTVTMELSTQRNWSGDGMYINVIVDGVKVSPRNVYKLKGNKQHTITLATNLKKGLHTFTIEKQSEATFGLIQVKAVSLNGEIAPAPLNNDLFIEFIGDSLICGYGVLYPNHSEGEYSSNQASTVYQDATKAFAYLTAKKMNADYSIVSETGIGMSYSSYTKRKMTDIYTKTCAQTNDNTEWNFPRRTDAVVITLGTNDSAMVGKGFITKTQMREGFKNFALQVRAKNPSAKIIWAYGALGYGAKDSIISVLNELGGEANGYYYVNLEYNGDGGGGHPSLQANAKNAETLTKALQGILCG